jgi:ATP-dependent exoDNAse (exonuclease V) alpha subunit
MHNYRKDNPEKLEGAQYKEYVDEAPLFARGEVSKLREFIKSSVKIGDDKQLLYVIDNGKIKPSKSLQDSIKSMIEGNQEFIMLDDQKVVYEEILKTATQCMSDQKKRTVIVKGGPGTGKTVVAINLLAKLTNEGYFVQYTSKNSAPRNVYAKKLTGHKKSSINNMFKGSGSYVDAEKNIVDVLICDEAHRLNDKSGMFHNLGENQIKEIIDASLCSVFFIDESQRVTLNDIGTVAEIQICLL